MLLQAKLGCHRRYIERAQYPVIHVTTNLLAQEVMGVTVVLLVLGEACIIADFKEDLDYSRTSRLDVVIVSSIVWEYPHVSIGMEVVHKFDLALMILQELGQCLRFWFR